MSRCEICGEETGGAPSVLYVPPIVGIGYLEIMERLKKEEHMHYWIEACEDSRCRRAMQRDGTAGVEYPVWGPRREGEAL